MNAPFRSKSAVILKDSTVKSSFHLAVGSYVWLAKQIEVFRNSIFEVVLWP